MQDISTPTTDGVTTTTQSTWFLGPDVEYDATAGVWTKLPHADVRVVGTGSSTATCWVHRDQLASVTAESDATGKLALEKRYSPYGRPRAGSTATSSCGAGESRGYIGERADAETGLVYLHARWYDAEFGRFITPDWWDPIDAASAAQGAAAGVRSNPVGMNRYAYAGNDPINKADRNGHAYLWDDIAAVTAGALSGVAMQAGSDIWNGQLSSWKDYAASGIAGAAAGEAGLHAGYASAGMASGAVAGATFGAVFTTTRSLLDGELPDPGAVGASSLVGAAGGAAGAAAGKAISNGLSNAAKGKLGEALSWGKATLQGKFGLEAQRSIPMAGPGPKKVVPDWTFVSAAKKFNSIESKFGYSAKLTAAQQKYQRLNPDSFQVDYWTPDHIGTMTGQATSEATTHENQEQQDLK